MLKPGGALSADVERVKALAKGVLAEIDAGHVEVATTVVHLGEIANVLNNRKTGVGLTRTREVLERLLAHPHVRVLDVSRSEFERAVALAKSSGIGVVDSLAQIVMRDVLKTDEIYTADRDDFPGFVVLPRDDAAVGAAPGPAQPA